LVVVRNEENRTNLWLVCIERLCRLKELLDYCSRVSTTSRLVTLDSEQ
jgi:hypothetical protein